MRKTYIKNKRVISRFLFLPRIIGSEMRWLEFSKIEQEIAFVGFRWIWIDKQWIN